MNTEKLARTTFVLERETSEQLDYVARRMQVSRSTLVRDVLREPVALMAGWMRSVPEDRPLGADEARRITDGIQLDLVDFIDRQSEAARLRGDSQ